MSKLFSRHTSIRRAPFATWNSLALMVTLISSVDMARFLILLVLFRNILFHNINESINSFISYHELLVVDFSNGEQGSNRFFVPSHTGVRFRLVLGESCLLFAYRAHHVLKSLLLLFTHRNSPLRSISY